jgi:hypothetical protein
LHARQVSLSKLAASTSIYKSKHGVCLCVCHTAFCVLTVWQNRQQLGIGIKRQLRIRIRFSLLLYNGGEGGK